ncbi:ATP11-domain-containing protein [Artomyces pyxidatus]|uniref:ATP11-domain-containing protein n=1 Tax=Artomyces pyxidatus TaxID=48021 RepID=A0ACB8SXH5_9AGAM|nr:ATP11-domain-containing protein [Artomyces pyxidatus]
MLLIATLRATRASYASPRLIAARRPHQARFITDYAVKYAEKLEKRAQEEGVSIDGLRARLREEEREQARKRLARAAEAASHHAPAGAPETSLKARGSFPPGAAVRKDSSPIKPLSSILNTSRIVQTPHTAEQISALWTAYHASRSGGTGRGYISASLPCETYEEMLAVAQRYPQFVLPVPRATDQTEAAYEFYIMQWDFYSAPPAPSPLPSDPLSFPHAAPPPASPSSNPRTATAIFTPLLEYKLRQSFATPYLVLTFHPDFAGSHRVVLLRGEITPAAAKAGDYMMSQQDAQRLAVGMQKFYLAGAGEGATDRKALLQTFHERPEEFSWTELLKHGDVGV